MKVKILQGGGMASFVNIGDVISAAVEIEKRGCNFYRQACERAEAGPEREFFAFMAAEEERHGKIFAAMLDRVGGLDLPVGSSEAEYLAYMQSSLDSHAFFSPAGAMVEGNPYRLAMSFEKDSIVYFVGMLDLVPESEKAQVQRCIDEEKRHLVLICEKQREAART